MKSIYLTIIAICFCSSVLKAQEKETHKLHLCYVAAGSPSIFTSVNYEICLFERSDFSILPRLGFGMNFFKPSFGNEFNFNTGITATYGKKWHKAEWGIGLVHQFSPAFDYFENTNRTKYKFIFYSGLGYRLQPSEKGILFKFMFTPTFTFNPGETIIFPYAELGVGYVFTKK